MENLKTFEDCCIATGRDPKLLPIVDHLPKKDADKVIADYKLPIVIEAVNKSIPPDWGNHNERKCCVWPDVIQDSSKPSGFGLSDHVYVYDYASADTTVGSRLTFRTEEGARYAFRIFKDLFEQVYL